MRGHKENTGKPSKASFFSVAEVASACGVCVKTVRRRIADGTLGHVYFGRRVLVPAAAIDALLREAGVKDVDRARSLEELASC